MDLFVTISRGQGFQGFEMKGLKTGVKGWLHLACGSKELGKVLAIAVSLELNRT